MYVLYQRYLISLVLENYTKSHKQNTADSLQTVINRLKYVCIYNAHYVIIIKYTYKT